MVEIGVAIAIVTYRCADLTIDCLRSIEAERSTPGVHIRAIVVDNESGDARLIENAIVAQNWSSWVTVISSPTNGGFGYGNNVAFQRAYNDGPPDYLYVLNPDTRVLKGAIGTLVRFLEAHPDVGVAGGSFENFDGSDWPIAFRFPSILSELEGGLRLGLATHILQQWVVAKQMSQMSQPTDWVSGASFMIRREVIDAIGGFDENYFLYFEDIDFCFRAKKAGYSTWYVPASRVMHVGGQSTKVMERNAAPKRLPAYWFKSRRRYFAVNHGVRYAIATDVVALLVHGLGYLKHVVLRRADRGVPYFLADLATHSILWPSNREVIAIKQFMPALTHVNPS